MKISTRKSSSRTATNYCQLLLVNPNSPLPKLSPFVSPDNVHSSNTHAHPSIQPSTPSLQSSLQDTVQSTTPPPCMSRSELSRTRCGRRVNFSSRLADYVQ
ncbi:unnamed protein product [Hymenolepis diminuta]|uniref:Kinesin motor domain-containing protein n=1 Tax=Hymenolepis diminuta TaxID=6216 RepID=A0A0R3SWF8_HYMDI|nr:unnamed protein product [Hymenolepis diminuta]